MNNKFDLLKLAKGMSVRDKAMLLFEDTYVRFNSNNKKKVLTSFEEDRILDDARKNHQMDSLNGLITLLNLSCMEINDLKISYLNFYQSLTTLEMICMCNSLKDDFEDNYEIILWELLTKGYTSDQLEQKEVQNEITKRHKELIDNYFGKVGLIKLFALFENEEKSYDYFTVKRRKNVKPNKLIESSLIKTVELAKKFRICIYKVEYIVELAGFNFYPEDQIKEIEGFKYCLERFSKIVDELGSLKVYQIENNENNLIASELFTSFLQDASKCIELSEKEKNDAKERVDVLRELLS